MSKRDFGCVALGRFLVVERYYQSHQPSSTHPVQGPGVDGAGGDAKTPDGRSGSRAPGRPNHR
jgi:hypothetical protein